MPGCHTGGELFVTSPVLLLRRTTLSPAIPSSGAGVKCCGEYCTKTFMVVGLLWSPVFYMCIILGQVFNQPCIILSYNTHRLCIFLNKFPNNV